MAIKLIISDLDGTLLNTKKLVSTGTIAAFSEASKQKVASSIATGRMHMAASFFGKTIGSNVPVISCNGTMIRDINTDEAIYEEYIDDAVSEDLLAFLYAHNIYCSWYIGTQIYAPYFSWDMFPGYRTVKNFTINELGADYKDYTKNITQIVLRSEENIPTDLLNTLTDKYQTAVKFQQNTGYTIDITPPHINKAIGVKRLGEYLGINKDEIMVLGDGDNDIDMLKYAGLSVATENAIPEAKKAASFVTDSCDNDGVAKAVLKVLQNNI